MESETSKGGLLKADDDTTYDDAAEESCDLYDETKAKNTSTLEDEYILNITQSTCEMTKNLYKGGIIYVGMECVSMLSLFIWFLSMIIYCRMGKCAVCGYLFSCIAVLSHAMGIVIYIVLTKIKFQDSCDNTIESDSLSVCADIGPKFSLGILGALLFISFLFILIACQVQKAGGRQVLSANPDGKVENSPEAENTQQNEIKRSDPPKNAFEPRQTYKTKQASMKANTFYINNPSTPNRNQGNYSKPSPALRPRAKFVSHPQLPQGGN